MSLFNSTLPPGSEAVKQGASRIRNIEAALNTSLGQIFSDVSTFLPNWITSGMIADLAITTETISAGAVGSLQLGTNAVAGYHVQDMTISASKLADGAIITQKIGDSQVTNAKVADNTLTAAKFAGALGTVLAGHLVNAYIGSYNGSSSGSVTASGMGFVPDVVVIIAGLATHGFAIALLAEAGGNPLTGNIHCSWPTASIYDPFSPAAMGSLTGTTNGITFGASDGFTINSHSWPLNVSGKTYFYIALKLS